MGATLDLTLLRNISPQEGALWEFYFVDIPAKFRREKQATTGLQKAVSVAETVGSTVSALYYKYLVSEISFPAMRSLETTYHEATRKHYYSSVGSYGDVSVTFRETEQFAIFDYLTNLQNRFYNNLRSSFISSNSGIMGIVIFYGKHNPIISSRTELGASIRELHDSIAEKTKILQPTKIFILNNLKLKTISDFSLSYANTEPLSVQATFAVEDIIPMGLSNLLGSLTPLDTTSFSAFV